MKEVLQAATMKLRSDVIKAEANLNNLLERPVGIGEHVDLASDVERLFLELLEKKHLLKEAEDYVYPENQNVGSGCTWKG
jgi:hypothetical protein